MIVIATRVVKFLASTNRRKPIQIHTMFESCPPRIVIKDIYFADDSIEAKYILILKTTSDSPEQITDYYLELSETGCAIPVQYFDVDFHKLEIELIEISNDSNTVPWICIEFDQLA